MIFLLLGFTYTYYKSMYDPFTLSLYFLYFPIINWKILLIDLMFSVCYIHIGKLYIALDLGGFIIEKNRTYLGCNSYLTFRNRFHRPSQ
jgi:hypothetical protein